VFDFNFDTKRPLLKVMQGFKFIYSIPSTTSKAI
jgi:hypothetical protein